MVRWATNRYDDCPFAHDFRRNIRSVPGLRIIGAHGAGFLPAYVGRSDASCEWTPKGCKELKKKPSDYLKEQIIIDSLVFDPDELKMRVDKYRRRSDRARDRSSCAMANEERR